MLLFFTFKCLHNRKLLESKFNVGYNRLLVYRAFPVSNSIFSDKYNGRMTNSGLTTLSRSQDIISVIRV